jgi:hypothetical protein
LFITIEHYKNILGKRHSFNSIKINNPAYKLFAFTHNQLEIKLVFWTVFSWKSVFQIPYNGSHVHSVNYFKKAAACAIYSYLVFQNWQVQNIKHKMGKSGPNY